MNISEKVANEWLTNNPSKELYLEVSLDEVGIMSVDIEKSIDVTALELEDMVATTTFTQYARNRLVAYNALNQMELISDDSINGTTTHKDAILAIKAEFPKP